MVRRTAKLQPLRISPCFRRTKELEQILWNSKAEPPSPTRKGRGKLTKPHDIPLVILAVDEAHTFRAVDRPVAFQALTDALRGLQNLSLFSLFLSTTVPISHFTSNVQEDRLVRVVLGELVTVQPFTDLGFDLLACVISLDGTWHLERLTEDEYICHLGRPLCVNSFRPSSLWANEGTIDLVPGFKRESSPESSPELGVKQLL